MVKLLNLKELKNLRKKFKNTKIGLCHGAFDIVHLGHLEHFREAKKNVKKLVVSITTDKFIKKGPNQPYNNENKRINFLKFIKEIDYLYLDNNLTAENVISNLKPDIYFKGKDYLQPDLSQNLKKEVNILKVNKGKLIFTKSELMSSTKILNNKLSIFSENSQKYLNNLSKKNSFNQILRAFENLENNEINIIGEPIIDSYVYCDIKGVTSKDPALSAVESFEERIGGGVISIAKIASNFVKKVNLYTYGDEKILKKEFKYFKNIKYFNFNKKKTIQEKKRFISSNRYEKLIQISNFVNNDFTKIENKKIIDKIKSLKNLIICDYGIGLFKTDLVKNINKLKSDKFINVQTNSLNYGLNLYSKYKKCLFMCLDKKEWNLADSIKGEINLKSFDQKKKNFKLKAITMGKDGSYFFSKNKKKIFSPVIIKKTVDTTGCGDAYFMMAILMIMSKLKDDLVPFVSNTYAGIHGQYIGNKKITNKIEFMKYLKSILNY